MIFWVRIHLGPKMVPGGLRAPQRAPLSNPCWAHGAPKGSILDTKTDINSYFLCFFACLFSHTFSDFLHPICVGFCTPRLLRYVGKCNRKSTFPCVQQIIIVGDFRRSKRRPKNKINRYLSSEIYKIFCVLVMRIFQESLFRFNESITFEGSGVP